jgi:hypothetical protein
MFGIEATRNEFDTYDTTIIPNRFAIALNTVLEQHQGKGTGQGSQWSGEA